MIMVNTKLFTNPRDVVVEGVRIYNNKYKADLEKNRPGQFVVIDVTTENAYVANFSEEALDKAKKAAPQGVFHLIKIGASGAFKVSYTSDATRVGLFR
jgi:hypothetical protein